MAQNLVIGKRMPNAAVFNKAVFNKTIFNKAVFNKTIFNKAMLNKACGFTYMGLLMLMAIAGIAMAGVGVVWHQDMQREREKELLFIGEQYRQAIGRYYETPTSGTKQYPQQLADLLLDKRGPTIQRHLRQLYADPLQFNPIQFRQQAGEQATEESSATWGLVKQQNQIVGVYSQSTQTPIKKIGFALQYAGFAEAQTYADWKFVYVPDATVATQASAPVIQTTIAETTTAETTTAETATTEIDNE